MTNFMKRGSDGLLNGIVLGFLIGLLTASSSILWIQSIVTFVVDMIPLEYHFEYISYAVFGVIGMGIGYFIDRQ